MEKSFRSFYQDFEQTFPNVKIVKNATFKNLTTFKIGGRIRAYVEVREVTKLLKVIALCKKHKKEYFILGNGSNLLVSDKTFEKVVIKLLFKNMRVKGEKLVCGAGVSLFALNNFALKKSLCGLEWSYGIPGTVGGAVKMNAGSFGGEMKDVVEYVYCTDGQRIFKKTKKALNFSYRNSCFVANKLIILKVVLNLKKGNQDEIESLCTKNFEKRLASQPYGTFNAGSVFKKPNGNYAPVLIESCGLKGLTFRHVQISPKHCGFIVNTDGKATFNQVFGLISKIKKTVFEKFGIMLETEVEILQ
jgi:UDP-N-acetylmuramate dehydrogenase